MSLNVVSVKINNSTPSIGSINYDKVISVKNDSQQNFKVKTAKTDAGLSNAVAVKVKNSIPSPENISVEKNITLRVDSQQDYKVKSINVGGGTNVKRLSDLLDVDIITPEQDDVLIFNEFTQKYESRLMNLGDFDLGNLDAGLF